MNDHIQILYNHYVSLHDNDIPTHTVLSKRQAHNMSAILLLIYLSRIEYNLHLRRA